MKAMTKASKLIAPAHGENLADVDWRDELEAMWGRKWGAQSEIGKLKMVLLSRPTENEAYPPPREGAWRGWNFPPCNLKSLQKQHDAYVDALKGEGVEVALMDVPEVAMGPYGRLRMLCYLHSLVVIDGGAVLSRYGLNPWRRGTEMYQQRALAKAGCPILYQIHGKTTFEFGGNMAWLDPKHMIIGMGSSSDMEGVKQVEPILRNAGVEEIHLAYYTDFIHLDLILGIADAWLAIYDAKRLNFHTVAYLRKKGFNLIEVPDDESQKWAINIVPIEPGKIVMPAGSPVTARRLRKEGVDVIEVEFSEHAKLQSAVRCCTCDMIRDHGPYLEK